MKEDLATYARKFGKHDTERLGIFIEMPYLKVNYKGKSKGGGEYLRRMLPGGPKTKCGTMDGYFDDEFRRIFKGESRGKRKQKPTKDNKMPFIPTGPSKKHSCPGDFFGTFGGILKEFSPKLRPQKKFTGESPNPVTNPGKKGGPGYIDITINKYPQYMSCKLKKTKKGKEATFSGPPMYNMHYPQPYFYPNPFVDPKRDPPSKRLYLKPKESVLDAKLAGRAVFVPTGPAKWIAGCKGGTFTKYPEWKKDKYLTANQRDKILAGKEIPLYAGVFAPQSWGDKTMFTTSVLYHTNFCVNDANYKTYEPVYVKHLLKNVY